MFEGFDCRKLEARGLRHAVRVGGEGPPVLLLHGYPQTHVTWLGHFLPEEAPDAVLEYLMPFLAGEQ